MKTGSNKTRIYNPPLLPVFSVIAIIYFVYYLVWRALFTLNPRHLFFSWMLWAAEAFGVISYLLFTWFTKNIAPLRPWEKPASGLTVDIFVPTFNEDLDIIEATLIVVGQTNEEETCSSKSKNQQRSSSSRTGPIRWRWPAVPSG